MTSERPRSWRQTNRLNDEVNSLLIIEKLTDEIKIKYQLRLAYLVNIRYVFKNRDQMLLVTFRFLRILI